MEYKLSDCKICPRHCGANRIEGKSGFCGMTSEIFLARAALHMWEEPCISGRKGSGAVFFSGCNLRCIFCQNHEIAAGKRGLPVSVERLTDIFLELQDQGAANLNLVTASHYLPQVVLALKTAKTRGLHIPIVYNSSGYETVESLRELEGLVDVYLPDFKYMDAEIADAFSHAKDYPDIAKEAIREMIRQSGPCIFDEDGYIKRGTIVRHLILPGHTRNSKKTLEYLHHTYGEEIYISIMNQYTPVREQETYTELNRTVTRREYEKVLNYAFELGIKNGFFQEGETAAESFIPKFDYEGVLSKKTL